MTFEKFSQTKKGNKGAAEATPKLCTLSPTNEPFKGNRFVKKAHYHRGFLVGFEMTGCRCSAGGLAPFVPQARPSTYRLFVACVAIVYAQVCRES